MSRKNKTHTPVLDKNIWADEVVMRGLRLSEVLSARVSGFFAAYGLTAVQFKVLNNLHVQDVHRDGIPAGSIGQWLAVRGPDITRLLDRLEKNGLVERIRKSDDRRVVRVRLSESGVALVKKIQVPLIKHNVEMLEGIQEKDLKKAAKNISRVLDAMEK